MKITAASPADIDDTVACLASAFAEDPITGFLLQTGQGFRERVMQFFSLLMRARIALEMPVFVARSAHGIDGATMGYSTARSKWPAGLTEEWDRFEKTTPGLTERAAIYDEASNKFKPPAPHYYLGVIGTATASQGFGIGTQLLKAF